MGNKKIRIALISMVDDERDFYQSLLVPFKQLILETFKTLTEFKKGCTGKAYSGVIVDMFTIIGASTLEKDFFFSLQQGFPVMQIRRVQETEGIKGLINQKRVEGQSGRMILESFINDHCELMRPRGVRLDERKKLSWHIHFFLSKDEAPTKSRLLDISKGGCFILSPRESLEQNSRIWISLPELHDKRPIACNVRWSREMKENDQELIGLGIQFDELSAEQQDEILDILKETES